MAIKSERLGPLREAVSPKQVARAIGASESSLKRWCDNGLLETTRTGGGHRRIPIDAVLRFVKERGHSLVDPEVIGLPPSTGAGAKTLDRGREALLAALQDANQTAALRTLLDLYLGGNAMTQVFDEVITSVLHEVGELWASGDMEVYEERRGVEFIGETLYEFGRLLPSSGEGWPRAMGGTLDTDPYTLAPRMVDLTLRGAGFASDYLGCNLPFGTFDTAIERERPDLFWLSVSALDDESRFVRGANDLFNRCEMLGVMFAIGGRALVPDIRRRIKYHAFCDTTAHLEAAAKSLRERMLERQEQIGGGEENGDAPLSF